MNSKMRNAIIGAIISPVAVIAFGAALYYGFAWVLPAIFFAAVIGIGAYTGYTYNE